MLVPSTMRTPPAGAAGRESAPGGAADTAAATAIGPESCEPGERRGCAAGCMTHRSDPRCALANSALPLRPNYRANRGRVPRSWSEAKSASSQSSQPCSIGADAAVARASLCPARPRLSDRLRTGDSRLPPFQKPTALLQARLLQLACFAVLSSAPARTGPQGEQWQTLRRPGRAGMLVTAPAPRPGPPRQRGRGPVALAPQAARGPPRLERGTTTAGAPHGLKMRRQVPLRPLGREAAVVAACGGVALKLRNGRRMQRQARRAPLAPTRRRPRAALRVV